MPSRTTRASDIEPFFLSGQQLAAAEHSSGVPLLVFDGDAPASGGRSRAHVSPPAHDRLQTEVCAHRRDARGEAAPRLGPGSAPARGHREDRHARDPRQLATPAGIRDRLQLARRHHPARTQYGSARRHGQPCAVTPGAEGVRYVRDGRRSARVPTESARRRAWKDAQEPEASRPLPRAAGSDQAALGLRRAGSALPRAGVPDARTIVLRGHRRLAASRLPANLRLLAHVDGAEKTRLLESAWMIVNTSIHEALPSASSRRCTPRHRSSAARIPRA